VSTYLHVFFRVEVPRVSFYDDGLDGLGAPGHLEADVAVGEGLFVAAEVCVGVQRKVALPVARGILLTHV